MRPLKHSRNLWFFLARKNLFFEKKKQKTFAHWGTPDDQGFALLIVLWSLVLLSLLAAQVTSAGRAEARLAAALRTAAQLQEAANGAVQETIWHMFDGAGEAWPQGAGLYQVKEDGIPVLVQVEDDRGKLDINQVPPPMLSALFATLGADKATADLAGNNIAEWRSQQAPGDASANIPPEYRMDGRKWGPGGEEFERLDELLLVRGMTPALYQASLPFLTLDLEQGPWLQYAPATVLAAIDRAKRVSGVATDTADVRGPVVLRVTATASGADGARFVRHVLLRFDGELSGPAWKYRILSWE